MKISSFLLAFGMLTFIVFSANAQEANASRVKILPTAEAGILRVLYAMETHETIQVKFFSEGSLVKTDKIKGGPYKKGLSKRYDVRGINKKDFQIEVSSPDLTVTYIVKSSNDRKTFVPHLEKVIYNNLFVANKN